VAASWALAASEPAAAAAPSANAKRTDDESLFSSSLISLSKVGVDETDRDDWFSMKMLS
jgi:hypothetical protein